MLVMYRKNILSFDSIVKYSRIRESSSYYVLFFYLSKSCANYFKWYCRNVKFVRLSIISYRIVSILKHAQTFFFFFLISLWKLCIYTSDITYRHYYVTIISIIRFEIWFKCIIKRKYCPRSLLNMAHRDLNCLFRK